MKTIKVKDSVDILTVYKQICDEEGCYKNGEEIILDMDEYEPSSNGDLNILDKFKKLSRSHKLSVKFLNFNGSFKKIVDKKKKESKERRRQDTKI